MGQQAVALRAELDHGGVEDSRMPRILFVCTGNICRSPFAEACLKSMLADGSRVGVSSAGIAAMVGSGMDPLMAHEAGLHGIDPGRHRARQLTGRILRDADIVLVLGPEHAEWIAAEFPEHLAKVVGLGQVAAVLRAQPRRARIRPVDMVAEARRQSPELVERTWIADPYRRGASAARDAVERIRACTELLATKVAWSA